MQSSGPTQRTMDPTMMRPPRQQCASCQHKCLEQWPNSRTLSRISWLQPSMVQFITRLVIPEGSLAPTRMSGALEVHDQGAHELCSVRPQGHRAGSSVSSTSKRIPRSHMQRQNCHAYSSSVVPVRKRKPPGWHGRAHGRSGHLHALHPLLLEPPAEQTSTLWILRRDNLRNWALLLTFLSYGKR